MTRRILRNFYLIGICQEEYIKEIDNGIDTRTTGTPREIKERSEIALQTAARVAQLRLTHDYDTSGYEGKRLGHLEATPSDCWNHQK